MAGKWTFSNGQFSYQEEQQQPQNNAQNPNEVQQAPPVAPEVQQPQQVQQQPSALEQAQKAYDDALARRNDASNMQISSYQDIIDRYGAPETREDAQAREAKEQRKRNLLAMIQLGANIGNMVNATTGGHMGSRSVETPQLVSAYDKARDTELTHRMKRDEKRNAARQAMINLKSQTAQGDLNNATTFLQQAQKADLERQKAKDKADLEKFKAGNTARENALNRASKEKIAADANALNWAKHNETKAYHEAMNAARDKANEIKEQEIELKKTGKGSAVIPVSVKGDTHVYKIPEKTLNNPVTVGALKSYMPKEYQDMITSDMKSADIQRIIGQYSQDAATHAELQADFNDFKALLKEYELGVNAGDAFDLEADLIGGDEDFDYNSLFDDEEE